MLPANKRDVPAYELLLSTLATLPGALFVVDEAGVIIYASANTQMLTGAAPEAVSGQVLWRCVPQLVSTSLYQAMLRARRTHQPLNIAYASPITRRKVYAQLVPGNAGLTVFFPAEVGSTEFQETLQQSEQRYLNLLESISDRVAILTPDGLVLEINRIPLEDAHLRREEVVGLPFTATPWWSYEPAVQQQLQQAIAQASQGEIVRFETRIRFQEGVYRDLAVTLTPYHNVEGQIEYLIYAALDISARKRAEADVHSLIDALPQFVWTGRPDGSEFSYSQSWHDYTGLTHEQAQEEGWKQATHPDDRQRVQEGWRQAVRLGMPYETEQRLRHGASGTYRWFLLQGRPQRDEQGTILRYVGTWTDIEDRKQAEQRLKTSEENWRVLAETVPQIVWMTRPDGQNEYKNQRWSEYVGEAGPYDTWGHLQYIHPDDRESSRASWQHALETGSMYEHEERLRNGRTGEYHWFLSRGAPVRDESGRIVKWFGTLTDIESQKRTEEALRQSQERANILMNSNIIGINIIEGEQVIEANDTFLHMIGYTREDLQEGRLNELQITSPADRARSQQALQALAAQQSVAPFEKTYICKDGSHLPVVVGRVHLQHQPFQGIGFVLDNTARKELEERKDAFISMAGHELRTPLAALKLQTQLLEKHLARQGMQVAPAIFAKLEAQINRVSRLVGDLLDISKIQAGKLEYTREPVELDRLLREAVETMQQAYPSHTILLCGSTSATLIGDRDRLEQVFVNLLSNAIKYSPQAKTVEVDVSTSAQTATVRICDHGLGIPHAQRDKIFERFYRVTDAKQQAIPGLGIGLSICTEIVKHHEGTITVESMVGQGSTFSVTFPIMTREEDPSR